MRKFLIAIAVLLGLVYIYTRTAEVQAIADTLKRGDWRFVALAFGVELVWLINVAAQYRAIYRALGLEEKIERLILLAAAANFVNVVAPSAGMGGMAVFISDSRRRSLSPGRVTVAGVLFVLFDYAGFFLVLTLGLFIQARRNNLNTGELVGSGVLLVIAAVLASLMYLGMRSAEALGRVLARTARLVNRLLRPLIHREYLSEGRAYFFAHEVAEGLHEVRRSPNSLYLPLGLAIGSKIFLIIILFLMFLAFKVPASVGTLIAAWSIAYLFLIISPTPAGIGVVEGALTLALNSMYVPLGAATVLALAYRGITFWLPLLGGLIAFRWLSHHEKEIPVSVKEDAEANH